MGANEGWSLLLPLVGSTEIAPSLQTNQELSSLINPLGFLSVKPLLEADAASAKPQELGQICTCHLPCRLGLREALSDCSVHSWPSSQISLHSGPVGVLFALFICLVSLSVSVTPPAPEEGAHSRCSVNIRQPLFIVYLRWFLGVWDAAGNRTDAHLQGTASGRGKGRGKGRSKRRRFLKRTIPVPTQCALAESVV